MNILLILIYISAIAFHSWLVWTCYQIYLAAWGKEKAKESWVNMLSTPYGQLFHPFFKWGGFVLMIGGSITLALIIINFFLELILITGGSHAT